ncbi:thiamine phosphate synthase [soil metagenome]
MYSKFQYISQGNTLYQQLQNIQAALDAGCTWIQYRFKNADPAELIKGGEQIKNLCKAAGATFIVNDDPLLAKSVEADGVHLGLTDMKVNFAKEIVGNKIIGGTANTIEDVLQRATEGCNYVGLGPYRFTTTKEKLSPVLGLEGYKKILNELVKENIVIPVYAIGGIEMHDVKMIMNTGVYGIAVSGMITRADDKKSLITELNSELYGTVNYC